MKAFPAKIIDFVLPPRCIVTGDIVDVQGMISPSSWGALNFISDPQCFRCGFPFDFSSGEAGEGNICAACQKKAPVYDRARSALVYDDFSRDIVLAYKHADQTHAVPTFIPWLRRAGKDILDEADYFVPVPLHRWRILRRRFNQSALIARYLSKETKIPCLPGVLQRIRSTQTQGHLKPDERKKNVRNAFCVTPHYKKIIEGKHIVLIDDVYTTGATVSECAKALLKAGAFKVDVLTLARVVKPQKV
jgi:ComF family protein